MTPWRLSSAARSATSNSETSRAGIFHTELAFGEVDLILAGLQEHRGNPLALLEHYVSGARDGAAGHHGRA